VQACLAGITELQFSSPKQICALQGRMNTGHTGWLDEEVKSTASNSFKGCRFFILPSQDNDLACR
jgi:hypothetical protein